MTKSDVVKFLLDNYGRTYAEEAEIRLADRPSPLYQLLVLASLLSTRISAEVAVAAARELFAAGYRTPAAMAESEWQDRVDALGRGHYRRYDESTATQLDKAARLLQERWYGDLRRLRDEAGGDSRAIRSLLTEIPRIGPTGADIFLREVQRVWPQVAPYLDRRVLDAAAKLDLPKQAESLADLVDSTDDLVRLSAALIRVSRHKDEIEKVRANL